MAAAAAPASHLQYRLPRDLLLLHLTVAALYGACTRLAFVTVPVYLIFDLDWSLGRTGLLVALYQLNRALANVIGGKFGSKAFFPLVFSGLSGFLVNGLVGHLGGEEAAETAIWFYAVCVGLSEVIVPLQEEILKAPGLRALPVEVSRYLRIQYSLITVGAAVAFLLGGLLMQKFGFASVCWFGVSLTALELVLFVVLRFRTEALIRQQQAISEEVNDELEDSHEEDDPMKHSVRDLGRAMSVLSANAKPEDERQVVWPKRRTWFLNYFIIPLPAFIASCIGVILSTSALFYSRYFGLSFSVTGLIMGSGEVAGVVAGFVATTPWALKPRTSLLVRPGLLVTTTLFGIGLFQAGAAIPFLPAVIVCQLFFQGLNDWASMVAAETMAENAPLAEWRQCYGRGQTYRRVGNGLTGLLGPVLFGVWGPLPFVLSATVAVSYGVIFAVALGIRGKQLLQNATDKKTEEDIEMCVDGEVRIKPTWYLGLLAVTEPDPYARGASSLPRMEVEREEREGIRPKSKLLQARKRRIAEAMRRLSPRAAAKGAARLARSLSPRARAKGGFGEATVDNSPQPPRSSEEDGGDSRDNT